MKITKISHQNWLLEIDSQKFTLHSKTACLNKLEKITEEKNIKLRHKAWLSRHYAKFKKETSGVKEVLQTV